MHLVIDGFGVDRQQASDPQHVHRFLDAFPDAINMTKIVPPNVYTYRGPTPEDWGVSGFVIIAESHISVHTFPDRDLINIDIFSCKAFDIDRAVQEVKAHFSLKDVKTWTLERGLEYLPPADATREPQGASITGTR